MTNSAMSRLSAAKEKADARANYAMFIASTGWSQDDINEYAESTKVLMGDDDAAALALFPVGTYETAEQARSDARRYWANFKWSEAA